MDDRGNPRPDHIVSFGPFRLFATERLLMKGDESVLLGGRALDILIALIEQAGEVLTRKALISRVWSDVTVEKANLRVHVSALRKALGDGHDGARFVVNVPGQGYCFVARVTRVTAERLLPPVEAAVSHVPKNLPARLTRMVDFLRCRSRMREHVPATVRRWQHMRKTAIVLAVLATA